MTDICTGHREGSAVALGYFDGVHRGHAAILAATIELASEMNLESVAFTFDRHPATVVEPAKAPPLLTTAAEKEYLIRGLGVDKVVVGVFDRQFASLPPEMFIREVLCKELKARAVVCGYDYRFGAKGAGDANLLRQFGDQLGFKAVQVPPVRRRGKIISSTLIRQKLLAGDLTEAVELLGHPYTLSGKVDHGRKRGRRMGFPTANIIPPPGKLVPADGVYAAAVTLPGGARKLGLLSIGAKPTFGEDDRTVEVYIDGHQGEIYGEEITLTFLSRLREIKKYGTMEELRSQISADLNEARALWANSPCNRGL